MPVSPAGFFAGGLFSWRAKLGILAEPMLSSRIDYQDAVAAGLGVTEYAGEGRAAQEISALWTWIGAQFELPDAAIAAQQPETPKATSLRDRLAAIARYPT